MKNIKTYYKYYCALLVMLASVVSADQIILDEPASNGIYHVDAPMDIRYRIRYNGMAALESTAVSLANVETQEVVAVFPNATWTRNDTNEDRSVADLWHIPRDLNNGTYILRVAGPASYPCSENGRAPYDRCRTSVEKAVTFHVLNP